MGFIRYCTGLRGTRYSSGCDKLGGIRLGMLMCVNSVSYSYAGKLTVAEVGEWSWSITRGVGY